METAKICSNCVFATQLFSGDVLCKKKGVTNASYSCKKHKLDLTSKTVRKKHTLSSMK